MNKREFRKRLTLYLRRLQNGYVVGFALACVKAGRCICNCQILFICIIEESVCFFNQSGRKFIGIGKRVLLFTRQS